MFGEGVGIDSGIDLGGQEGWCKVNHSLPKVFKL